MFLPSLLGRSASVPGGDGGRDDAGEDPAFTCTPGKAGLTRRFPLTLRYECEPGKVLPLDLLPLPYVLPGEEEGRRLSLFYTSAKYQCCSSVSSVFFTAVSGQAAND